MRMPHTLRPWSPLGFAFAFLALAPLTAAAQDRPATRPSDRPPATQPGDRGRPAARQQGEVRPGQQRGAGQVAQVLEAIRTAALAVEPTPEQTEKIESILAAARQELANVLPRLNDSPQQARQEVQGITQGAVEDIAGVLSIEQRSRFREEMDRMRQQAQQRGQGPGRPGDPAATTRPGSQPNPDGRGGAQRQRPGQYVEQLAAAIAQLDLNEQQRSQIDEALNVLREDLRRLQSEARENGADQQTVAQALRQRSDQFRATLEEILTPEQMQRLYEDLQRRSQRPEGNPPPGERPPGEQPRERRREEGQAGMAMNDRRGDEEAQQAAPPQRSAFLDRLSAPPGLDIGQTLAESVNVVTLTNKEHSLRQMIPRSKPLVVLLGSSSSPTFRDHLGDFLSLRQQIGRDADLLIIYTREQHASGEWTVERNSQEGIEIAQHADIEARIAAGRALRQEHELRIEIVVDTMDDSALRALVGEAPHCAALVLAPDGTLVGRQQWLDPTGLPAIVEQARQGLRPTETGADGN